MLCTLSFEECGAILIQRQSLAASLFCLQAENILSLRFVSAHFSGARVGLGRDQEMHFGAERINVGRRRGSHSRSCIFMRSAMEMNL